MNTDQNSVQQQQEASAVHFLDYWQILFARKEIVIAVSLMMILTGIFITRQMPKVYSATALIQVQPPALNIDVVTRSYSRYDPIFLRTQFEIIKSRPVIEAVVRNLQLDDILGNAYGWTTTQTASTTFDRTVRLIQGKTSLTIRRDTELIQITVELDKPDVKDGEAAELAARVANTIADVFLSQTAQTAKELAEQKLNKLREEIEKLRRQAVQAEDELGAMREKYGITLLSDLDSGLGVIRSEIAQLNADKTKADMVAGMKKSKYEKIVELSAGEAAASLSILVGDQSLQPLIAEQQRLEMQAAAQRQAGLGPQHPEVVQNKALLDELKTKITERVADIKLGLKVDYEQSQAESDMIGARLAEVRNSERQLSSGGSLDFFKKQKEIEAMRQRLSVLEERMVFEGIATEIPSTGVRIIEQAKVPEIPIPVSPNFGLNVTLSVVAGLFFGLVLAFFVEYLDTTIKSVEEVEKFLNSNVIGIIPQKMRVLNDPAARPKHSEVYRVLRMNLKSSAKLGPGKVITFTSSSAGEGKSLTSFNLSHVCAEVGDKVLLIDADLHRPRQHKILNIENADGLCNVIVGEVTLDNAIRKTDLPNLDFMPAGRMSSAGVYGLLDTDEMRNLLAEVGRRYDRVILDSPPIIGVSDTAQLARLCDGVVLVVQHRKYPRALCKRAKDMIASMGGNLLGVVLNNVNASHDYSSYYYEHQYYYYYYTNDSDGKTKRVGESKTRHPA